MKSRVRSPMLRYALRKHPKDDSAQNQRILQLLAEMAPEDDFSLSQWELGLGYYQRRLKAFGVSGKIFLDLGCGAGNWALAAASLFEQVIAIDIMPQRLAVARQIQHLLGIKNITFVAGDLLHLPIASQRADWVLSYNVLPYVASSQTAFSEMQRVQAVRSHLWLSWAEYGISLFYGLDGALSLSRKRAVSGLSILLGAAGLVKLPAPGAMRSQKIEALLQQHGYTSEWQSWQDAWPTQTMEQLPKTLYGFPLFREIKARQISAG